MTDAFHREGLIPRLTKEETVAAAEAIGVPTYMCDLAIFQVLFRHPPLAKAVNDFLAVLLFKGDLDDRLRELVIMRVGWVTGSVYEWAQHWRIAPQFGVSEGDLMGVRDWENHDGFGSAERAVLAATDEALAGGPVTAETWAACERELGGPTELMELFTAIGAWSMISTVLRALEIPLEDDVDAWPPTGMGPETS
jgi:alkylhydroperoxidase family enzyme